VLKQIRQYISKRKQFQNFRSEFWQFRAASDPARFDVEWNDRYPCLDDRTSSTYFYRHYVYHTAWAARVLAKTKPAQHVDTGSYLHFATLVSAFVPVRFFDYRPAQVVLPGLETGFADLLALPFDDGSVPSLSCMHVVEHVGLRPYGDPLDPNGDLKAILELKRVLASGGTLLFVVPIGRPRVMFNAHRIYSFRQVRELLSGRLLRQFALIPDRPEAGGSLSTLQTVWRMLSIMVVDVSGLRRGVSALLLITPYPKWGVGTAGAANSSVR